MQNFGKYSYGTKLLNVAIHEIGHALGFPHTEILSSIMYPYYNDSRNRLTKEDIFGLQRTYGHQYGKRTNKLLRRS